LKSWRITRRSSIDATTLKGHASENLRRRSGVGAIAEQILNGGAEPQQLSYELEQSTVHVNTRKIDELNWFLIVEQNEDNGVQPLRTVLAWNLLVGAMVTAVVISRTYHHRE
jgi:hypothetical protein